MNIREFRIREFSKQLFSRRNLSSIYIKIKILKNKNNLSDIFIKFVERHDKANLGVKLYFNDTNIGRQIDKLPLYIKDALQLEENIFDLKSIGLWAKDDICKANYGLIWHILDETIEVSCMDPLFINI